jgi:hypothetical protein
MVTERDELPAVVEQFREYIQGETLAVGLMVEAIPRAEPAELKLGGHEVTLYVKVVTAES